MAGKAKKNDADATVTTAPKVPPQLKPFKSGAEWNGNAAGRPKGSRHKLGAAFIDDLYAAWQAKGKDVIERVIKDRPHEFIKSVASILPKEVEVKTTTVQELSDDDLAAALIALRSATALANAGEGSAEKARH